MSKFTRKLAVILAAVALGGAIWLADGIATADPVPLPCDPADCPPIDPCTLAPERCNPPDGGPIESDE
ncbi:MAG: hypothetical protein Q7V31_14075 [Parvibaculum sp.]|uniref:hypothetical protein n=1 Tax=Parvibaculum sp. TaxID=2024848 RepID=UPI00271E5614|nr:hypothetical protein [Parvibaculum sp.]MDO8840046.1 hypothetical protein [Parvibaculum sp.]